MTLITYRYPWVFSIGLHLVLLIALGISTHWSKTPAPTMPTGQKKPIQAMVLNERKIQAEIKKIEKKKSDIEEGLRLKERYIQNQAKKKLQQDKEKKHQKVLKKKAALKKKKRAEKKAKEALIKKKKEEALRKQRLKEEKIAAEKKRQAALEKAAQAKKLRQEREQKANDEALRQKRLKEQKQADDKKRKDARKKARDRREKIAKEALRKERIAQRAAAEKLNLELMKNEGKRLNQDISAQNQSIISEHIHLIGRKVEQHWVRPKQSPDGLQCILSVRLMPGGDVITATVIKGSGNAIFDRSAVAAIRSASPLPVPDDIRLFNENFKTIQYTFAPK